MKYGGIILSTLQVLRRRKFFKKQSKAYDVVILTTRSIIRPLGSNQRL